MSYEKRSRRRGNGYGVLIEGHAADAHYDRLGQDAYSAEAIRSDNLRLMDEDMVSSERTLQTRVPLSIMEQDMDVMEKQIATDTERLRAEAESQRIVDDQGNLRFPVVPGEDPLAVTRDIPVYEQDAAILDARMLEMQAMQRELASIQAAEFAPANIVSTGVSDRLRREAENQTLTAVELEAQAERAATQSLSQAQRANAEGTQLLQAQQREAIEAGLVVPKPVAAQQQMPVPVQQRAQQQPGTAMTTQAVTYPGVQAPPDPAPLQFPQQPAKKSNDVLGIVGAGLLALFLLRK